jgi:hypothetical protein
LAEEAVAEYCQTFHIKSMMIVHETVVVVVYSFVESQSIRVQVLRDTTPKDSQII